VVDDDTEGWSVRHGTSMARAARSSQSRRSLCWAVSTMRRCMVPSGSTRVATTLINPFCHRHNAVAVANLNWSLACDNVRRPAVNNGLPRSLIPPSTEINYLRLPSSTQ
jgi:hypothetical protein